MSYATRPPFDPKGEFVAAKDFKFSGEAYATGDEFPWEELSCSERKLRQLYDNKLINLAVEEPDDEEDLDDLDTDDEDLDDEDDGTEDEEDDEDEELIFDPELHSIDNPSRGIWSIVDEDGDLVVFITPHEAKRLRKRSKPTTVKPECILEDEEDE